MINDNGRQTPTKIYGECESRLMCFDGPDIDFGVLDTYPGVVNRIKTPPKAPLLKDLMARRAEYLAAEEAKAAETPTPTPEPPPRVMKKRKGITKGDRAVWGGNGGMDLMQLNFANLDADVRDPMED